MSLIAKSDIASRVPEFSIEVPDRKILPHINNAELYDLKPLFPLAFYNKLNNSPGAELTTFINTYIKPVLVFQAYLRYLPVAGINATQFGMVHISDQASMPVSDQRISIILANTKSLLSVALTDMYNALLDANYTYDAIVYDFKLYKQSSDPTKRSYMIRGIKAKGDED